MRLFQLQLSVQEKAPQIPEKASHLTVQSSVLSNRLLELLRNVLTELSHKLGVSVRVVTVSSLLALHWPPACTLLDCQLFNIYNLMMKIENI